MVRRTDEHGAQWLIRPGQAVERQLKHGAVAVLDQLLQRRVIGKKPLLQGILNQPNKRSEPNPPCTPDRKLDTDS